MLRVRIRSKVVVDVIILQGVNQCLNKSTVNFEPSKIVAWIFRWNHGLVKLAICPPEDSSSRFTHFSYLCGDVLISRMLISNIAHDNSFSSYCWHESIK
jgi:hypothetical protein